ncbi:MAG: hypothetical protein IPM52_05825 [Bacteroidetes bacterium]|nr:hypothetical protein [Bacteroidota bacterium]
MEQLTRRNFWIIATNSLASFVLSYLIIFYLNQLSYVLTSGMYGYPVSVDYATVAWHIEPYQWIHDAVFLIFSSGYVLTLIFGLLMLLGFYYILPDALPVKVFFFWFVMHAGNFVFGGLLLGNLMTQGIGHVFNWMYLLDTPRMLISLTGFFGLLVIALMSGYWVAISANAYFEKYNEKMAPFFITAQVFVPYILGSLLLYLYFYPKPMFHERYGWIVLGVMLIIFYSRSLYMDDLLFEEDDQRSFRLMKGLIVTAAVFYVVSRVVMSRTYFIDWN